MKQRLSGAAVCVLCFSGFFLLSGCSWTFSNHRDIERTLPVQTLGIDSNGAGISVSMSSVLGLEDSTTLVISAAASDMEHALLKMQDYSPRDELYFAHVQYILIGDSLARDNLSSVLDWVERSPSMRMDTALFIAKETAGQAVVEGSENDDEITQRMASLEREERSRGMQIYSLREIASSLAERGFALCTAVEAITEKGTVKTDGAPGRTIIPAGYAVLKDNTLIGYLTANESLAVQLAEGSGQGTHLSVGSTVLEIFNCDHAVTVERAKDGQPVGIIVTTNVKANLLETESNIDLSTLNRDFSRVICSFFESAVSASGSLDCDILRLADDTGLSWQTIRSLPITVSASGTVVRGLDAGLQEEP